jgi:hypothetical protein
VEKEESNEDNNAIYEAKKQKAIGHSFFTLAQDPAAEAYKQKA